MVENIVDSDKLDDVLETARALHRSRRVDEMGLTDAGSSPVVELIGSRAVEEEIGFRRRVFWKSCCGGKLDSRVVQYFVQVSVAIGIMIFCAVSIILAEPLEHCTGDDTTVYFALLTTIIGFLLPSPSISGNK
jgi:hypothetical protein